MDPRPQDVVRHGYDAIGERYHAWSAASPTRLRQVDAVLSRLDRGSVVVDLGCGTGDPATRLLAQRHSVLGVDISWVQLQLARRRSPTAQLVQADVTQLELSPGSVDAVVSFYLTGHLPSDEHRPLFAAVARWLRPGGLLMTSAPLGAGDTAEDDWLGVPMFFGGIGADETVAAVAAAGLVVESAEVVSDDPEGRERFLWLTATRRV